MIKGEGDVGHLLPGYCFGIYEHPRDDVNARWRAVSVKHSGEQPQALQHEAPDGRGMEYKSSFLAIPEDTRYVPKIKHRRSRLVSTQTAVVTGPEGEEIYPDKYGRVKVQFHWDREGKRDQNSSCWIRVSQTWAGVEFGGTAIPRVGQEVIVAFEEGDPDRPIIVGRAHNDQNLPIYELPSQKSLSGFLTREVKGHQRNQYIMDDTTGQIQVQLSSDHQLSQLNMGYITRLEHVAGRKDFRGEGFELRTSGWGVIRAARGTVFTTDPRKESVGHQKDIREMIATLRHAADQHSRQATLSSQHMNQNPQEDTSPIQTELKKQSSAVYGTGKKHSEVADPHMLFSSPAGIATTTPRTSHLRSGRNLTVTTGEHCSVAAGKSFLACAMQSVRLFAHKAGMKFFAAHEDVDIQAQGGELEVLAEQNMRIASKTEKTQVSSPKEWLLTAANSYIRVDKSGVLLASPKKVRMRCLRRSLTGPATEAHLEYELPRSDLQLEELSNEVRLSVRPTPGRKNHVNEPFTLYEDGAESMRGNVSTEGIISFTRNPNAKEYKLVLSTNEVYTYREQERLSEGDAGANERSLQSGFRYFTHNENNSEDLKGLKEQLLSFFGKKKRG